jgi:hypothetical protein
MRKQYSVRQRIVVQKLRIPYETTQQNSLFQTLKIQRMTIQKILPILNLPP